MNVRLPQLQGIRIPLLEKEEKKSALKLTPCDMCKERNEEKYNNNFCFEKKKDKQNEREKVID